MEAAAEGHFASLVTQETSREAEPLLAGDNHLDGAVDNSPEEDPQNKDHQWAENMRLLIICFLVSGVYTVCTYFFPILRNIPIFGPVAANTWLWTLNPSFAYIGQGIIMGAETTLHMTLGAVVGWAILSPLAKTKGWAPGDVGDWEHGSKGWIVWVSLAIMLVDAIVSLAYVALNPLIGAKAAAAKDKAWLAIRRSRISRLVGLGSHEYTSIQNSEDGDDHSHTDYVDRARSQGQDKEHMDDAPPEQRVTKMTVSVGLVLSIIICVLTIHIVFGDLVPLYATVIAVFMALLLSIMGVRALGETDLNPVSGISKLAQLFFAFIIPQSHKSSVLINLVAGAVVSCMSYPHSVVCLLIRPPSLRL